jgi:GDP/UDP-N,N'-diacetylbacillosamine 2-epimerase (hydrolysing)
MGGHRMKIGILTSSRADYGILKPLISKMYADAYFNVKLIVFGTHLSENHGYTINEILQDGFHVEYKLNTTPKGDTPRDISASIGDTIAIFADFWSNYHKEFDLILCLGDRFEMFAAVSSTIPFNVPIGHLHGGETTLGAIDNFFRHSITLASKIHFTSTDIYAKRVSVLIESEKDIFNVGALSLDSLNDIEWYDLNTLNQKFNLNITPETILITVHPETVFPEKNLENLNAVFTSLIDTKSVALFSLPNADTFGLQMREKILEFASKHKNIMTNEHFGIRGYFSAMKHCAFLLGNTSSGIIEAASFGKYVINVGKRQEGRAQSGNILNASFEVSDLSEKIEKLKKYGSYKGENIYFKPNVADQILTVIKEYHEKF